jgi:hypothetical protein
VLGRRELSSDCHSLCIVILNIPNHRATAIRVQSLSTPDFRYRKPAQSHRRTSAAGFGLNAELHQGKVSYIQTCAPESQVRTRLAAGGGSLERTRL